MAAVPSCTTGPSAPPSQSLREHKPKANQTQEAYDLTLAKKPTQQSFQLVLHALRSYRDNCPNPSYEPETLFALTQKEYEEFLAELEADYLLSRFVSKAVRINWDPKKGRLELIKPNSRPRHIVIGKLRSAITKKLEAIVTSETNDEIKEVAESIECWGRADIVLENKGSRQPSFQFGIDVEPEEPPGLVAEISFENRHKNDRVEAKKYIEQSGFNIKAVLVVNIWPEVDSTISLYRTRLRTIPIAGSSQDIMDTEEVFNRKPFHQPSGQHVNGKTNLSLTLDDFVSGENCQEWKAIDLNITFADLAAVLDK